MSDSTDAPDLAALRLHLLNYREIAPLLIQMNKLEATVKHEKYLALVKAGFSESQALELCR